MTVVTRVCSTVQSVSVKGKYASTSAIHTPKCSIFFSPTMCSIDMTWNLIGIVMSEQNVNLFRAHEAWGFSSVMHRNQGKDTVPPAAFSRSPLCSRGWWSCPAPRAAQRQRVSTSFNSQIRFNAGPLASWSHTNIPALLFHADCMNCSWTKPPPSTSLQYKEQKLSPHACFVHRIASHER